MILMNPVDACVARVCNLDCAMVYRTIERMEAGEEVVEVAAVDGATRQAVLDELKAVMAVYDARDEGASCKLNDRSVYYQDRVGAR